VRPFLVYNGLRLAVLVATFIVVAGIWLLVAGHFDWVWTLVISFVVSGVVSFRLLNGPRSALARRIDERAHKAANAFEALRNGDDAEVDAEFEAASHDDSDRRESL